ncbi:hypothetical protein M9H77_07603 [Catharanthus roseus]|uniref:Uncharacterized protein n=1 Tax=Catharanthus roseus TaxID=4058 RepID=A0ACC0BVP6_CATRO|nr:hypothetical protein M9H77_07603 [Catharanthus roseus]
MKERYCDISLPLNSLSIGNVMVNPFTCDLALDVDHMLKCPSLCAYLDEQLLDSIARIKPSYHDLELSHDNLFFDLLVANFSSSCASMWSKMHIFFGSFVENGYGERIRWFSRSLGDNERSKESKQTEPAGDAWVELWVDVVEEDQVLLKNYYLFNFYDVS